MMHNCLMLGTCGFLLAVVGCGSGTKEKPLPATVPATSVVTLDGSPLSQALVTFIPRGETAGIECIGITDDSGRCVLKQLRGGAGVPPGEYSVVINRYLTKDGAPVAIGQGEAPANLGAVDSLPPRYSIPAESQLMAAVSDQGGEFKFELKSR